MAKKLKLMIILGTRPEIIRLSQVIKISDQYFDLKLIHTGQNYDYELNEIFFEELGVRRPDYYLNAVGSNLGETIGNIIAKSYEVMVKEKPDALLILGDTNSALSAIAAKRLKLPIFHMEAGNRCWDNNVAEMTNRKIVDHISDVNLPYTENSRNYLLNEGVDGKFIFVTGSPMLEVVSSHLEAIAKCQILSDLALEKGKYIIVSSHREENVDNIDNLTSIVGSINSVAEKYRIPVIVTLHPRTKARLEETALRFHPLVKCMKPFGFIEYTKLESNSLLTLSDSGTLTEESAILDFPAVLLRTSTERPEGLDSGSIVIGGIEKENVLQACELALKMHEAFPPSKINKDYDVKDVSMKVVKIIQSYTSIINKAIWLKKD